MKIVSKLLYAAVLAGSLTLGTVVARPPPEFPVLPAGIHYFFSDAGHSDQVGLLVVECDGSRYFLFGGLGPHRVYNQAYFCPPDW